MIRSTIFNLLFYSFSFLTAMTCWGVAKLSTRSALWTVLNVWGRSVLWMVRTILGARVEVRGLEHVKPGQSQLFVSKHQSELDIVMQCVLMRDISAIAMEELTRLPFFGTLLRKADVVLIKVDGGPQGRTEQAIAGGRRIRAQNRSMVIYPEGELMKLGARERYRRGAGHLYKAMEVEAVPIACSLGVIWPQRQWRKTCGATGAIEFLDPIPPGRSFETFMSEIEDRIETRTMALIEEHATGPALEAARNRHARGSSNAD